MKEYIVIKDILNIRNKPSDESDDTFVGQLFKGERVWLDEEEYYGVIPKGGETNIWKKRIGTEEVVAKDGVREKTYEDKKEEFLNDKSMGYLHNNSHEEKDWKVSWAHIDLEIWKIWKEYKTMGEGVKIAIIDSGIADEKNMKKYASYFNYGKIKGINILSLDGKEYIDSKGHGTKIASIIVGQGDSFIGIAPAAELFICKYYENEPAIDNLIKALNKLPLNIEVVCISSGFFEDDISETDKNNLINILKEVSKRAIIFCSVGDDENHNNNPFDRYPSSLSDYVVSVASINKHREISLFSTKSNFIQISAPGEELPVIDFKKEDISIVSGTSFSVPIMAGMTALLKSHFSNYEISKIKTILLGSIEPLGNKLLYGNGIINLVKAFAN